MNHKANSKKGEQCDVELNPKPYPKAGDKRSRHVGSLSSVSETDTSLNDETQVKQSKKKQKSKDQEFNQTENIVMKELKEINIKLNNVLTKDSTELKTMIKDIISQLKDELLGSITLRVEILESEIFEKAETNSKLSKQIEEMSQRLKDKEDENEMLKRTIKAKETANDFRFNDIEQYSKRSNIKIDGVQDKENETSLETADKVIELLNRHITDLKLNRDDIDIAHRIGPFNSRKSRPIIMKMISRMTKTKIMRNAKALRTLKDPVYVNDHLTKLNTTILACVRKKQRDIVVSTWSREGNVYYRDVNEIVHKVVQDQYQYWLDLPWPST